jgi:hypothetical protein
MRSTAFLLGTALFVSSAFAATEDWVTVAKATDMSSWIDRESVKADGEIRTFHYKFVTTNPDVIKAIGAMVLVDYRIDCGANTIQSLGSREYSADGKLLESNPAEKAEPTSTTEGDTVMRNLVC